MSVSLLIFRVKTRGHIIYVILKTIMLNVNHSAINVNNNLFYYNFGSRFLRNAILLSDIPWSIAIDLFVKNKIIWEAINYDWGVKKKRILFKIIKCDRLDFSISPLWQSTCLSSSEIGAEFFFILITREEKYINSHLRVLFDFCRINRLLGWQEITWTESAHCLVFFT